MEVTRIRALRGPNLWTRHTAIEAMVRCAPGLESDLSADQQAFEKRLRHMFPGLGRLQPGERDAHLSMAHALEAVVLHLQIQAGCPVTFSRTTATPEEGLFQVVVEYSVEQVGRLALQLAEQLCLAAFNAQSFDVDKALNDLRELDEDLRLGPSTGSIVDAALARGIPFRRLSDGSLVQFGWGSKQRRIQAAEVDSTSAIAESIAQDKDLTKHLLQAAGVPVPVVVVSPSVRAEYIGSTVEVEFVVDAQGKTSAFKVMSPVDIMLSGAVLDAVRKWEFKPAVKGGVPVTTKVVLPLHIIDAAATSPRLASN